MEAQLTVGFPPFFESYVSRVNFSFPHYVRAESKSGKLFSHLVNKWELYPVYHNPHTHQSSGHHQSTATSIVTDQQGQPVIPHATRLKFLVEFEFASQWYQTVANMFFKFCKCILYFSFCCHILF